MISNYIRMSCIRQLCTSYNKRHSAKKTALNITELPFGRDNFRCSYFDVEENLTVPFRFHRANGMHKPLIVYFGGSGTVGCDNLLNYIEFFAYAGGRDILRSDVNVLVPQMIVLGNDEFDNLGGYVSACCRLITALSERCLFDTEDVRVFGTSLGGMCVWNMLVCHSDMMSKALSVTGEYSDYTELTSDDFDALKNKSLWLVHADDDAVVSPLCDINCYPLIKQVCADVLFTRRPTGGHHISKWFYHAGEHIHWLTE